MTQQPRGGCWSTGWAILGALSLIWLVGGILLTLGAANSTNSSPVAATLAAQGQSADSIKAAQGIAGGIIGTGGIALFACTGIPAVLLFGILWMNSRNRIRQEMMLANQQSQLALMQQQLDATKRQ